MNNIKVSVIMSVYNEKKEWLEEAINSILNQTYENFEYIIIMDNPHNYELIELLKDYQKKDKRIILHINEENVGLVKSLNKALKLVSGEYIARMDADDISDLVRFEKQVEFLKVNNTDLCATGVIIMDEHGEELYRSNIYGQTHKKASNSLPYRNIFPHGSWMFKKSVLNLVNEYSEVNQAEDYDLLFRLLSCGGKISVINEYLFKYRLRNTGISFSNLYKQKRTMVKISKAYLKSNKYVTPININDINSSEQESMNYNKYQNLYTEGIALVRKRKYVKGFKNIFISIVKCKYRRLDIKSIMMLKLIDKFY